MKLRLLIFFLVFSFLAKSEGIPVDSNGNITVQHVNVSLTENQRKELEAGRVLVLTENQLEKLKGIWESREVRVLDPHHNDCTCDEDYAIWSSPTEISFLKTPLDERYHDSICSSDRLGYKDALYIGIGGEIYYHNEKILRGDIEGLLIGLLKNKEYILTYIAPFKNNPKIAELKKTIELIRSFKEKGQKIYLM